MKGFVLAWLLAAASPWPLLAQTILYPPPWTPGVPAEQAPGTTQDLPPPPAWLPRTTAILQALDKVNARSAVLTVPVGRQTKFGSLTITVKVCVVRPPGVPADAAAFLEVSDSKGDRTGFSGWMLRSAPAVSMLEHAVYDIRTVGCGV